jgi:hypothetical protein
LEQFILKHRFLLQVFLGFKALSVNTIALFLEDSTIVMIASHDSAGRGLFDAEKAGGVGSGHVVLINHFNQLQSHLSHPGDTYRVYLLYFLVSQHSSGVSIDFLWVYSIYY